MSGRRASNEVDWGGVLVHGRSPVISVPSAPLITRAWPELSPAHVNEREELSIFETPRRPAGMGRGLANL
jgi:hypothetical protein